MAKVQIADDYVDIQLSLLEKLRLPTRSRRVPLLHIVGVETPPANDVQTSWADVVRATHRWGEGIMYDDGTNAVLDHDPEHSSRMLTIDLCDEDVPRVEVELDDEAPDVVADRIRLAVAAAQASAIQQMRARSAGRNVPAMPASEPPPPPANDSDWGSDSGAYGIPYRITPLPSFYSERPPAPAMRLDDDRSLARLGAWLIGLGVFGLLTGAIIVAGGVVPGLLAIGAGAACAGMGGVALAVVLHHQ